MIRGDKDSSNKLFECDKKKLSDSAENKQQQNEDQVIASELCQDLVKVVPNTRGILIDDTATKKFVKIMHSLVVYNFGLMLDNSRDYDNMDYAFNELKHHTYPVIVKTSAATDEKQDSFWFYMPKTNNNACYFEQLLLNQEQTETLNNLFRIYQTSLKKNSSIKVNSKFDLETAQASAIIEKTTGYKLEHLKPLKDGRYYSMWLLALDARMTSFFNEHSKKTVDTSEHIRNMIKINGSMQQYSHDKENYPNAIIIKGISSNNFWFYYKELINQKAFIFEKLNLNTAECQYLNSFFASQKQKLQKNNASHQSVSGIQVVSIITQPDEETKLIDEIITRHVSSYTIPLWCHKPDKLIGSDDGMLVSKTYASNQNWYTYKARWNSYDLNFMEVNTFNTSDFKARLEALQEFTPMIVKNLELGQFIFCYWKNKKLNICFLRDLTSTEEEVIDCVFNCCKKDGKLLATGMARLKMTRGAIRKDIELYSIVEKHTGYRRSLDDYEWYFHEAFCEATGSNLFSYVLGNTAPRNILINIPGQAPGLISQTVDSMASFIIKEIFWPILFYDPLNAKDIRQLMHQLEDLEQKAVIQKFLLKQRNIWQVIATTWLFNDADAKLSNIGLILRDAKEIKIARLDFDSASAQLTNNVYDMSSCLFERSKVKNYSNYRYGEFYGGILYTKEFQMAIANLANINIEHVGTIITTTVARVARAWQDIGLDRKSIEKFYLRLFGPNRDKWCGYIEGEKPKIAFNQNFVKVISEAIINALNKKKKTFSFFARHLEHINSLRAIESCVANTIATTRNFKVSEVLSGLAGHVFWRNKSYAVPEARGIKLAPLRAPQQLCRLNLRARPEAGSDKERTVLWLSVDGGGIRGTIPRPCLNSMVLYIELGENKRFAITKPQPTSANNSNVLLADLMENRFIKIMQGLVAYRIGLMLIAELNADNKATMLQALTIHDYPIIIKTTKNQKFWLYLPHAKPEYLRPLSLKQSQWNALQAYFQQQGLSNSHNYKLLTEPTFATVQLNKMIIKAAKIQLEHFKPLADERYYSLVLLTLPGFAKQPESAQLKLLRPHQTDARHYPNAILVQDRASAMQQFWFYYAFPQAEEASLRVLPVNAAEQQALRWFFAARAYDKAVTITTPDASTQIIDNIILRHVPTYSRPLLAYLGVKLEGLTDGFLAGIAYAILEGPRYIYKARLLSFDLSFMAVAELEPAKLLACKKLLPALIRDCQQQFWLCYMGESSTAPVIRKFEHIAAHDLAFLNAMFDRCEKDELLAAMNVNRMRVTIDGASIPGVVIYNLIAQYTGYTRPQDDYLWYFYELFGDVVGGEVARYLLGPAAPKNQLVSIPDAAPGLISELFPGDFINFAEIKQVMAGIGTTLLYPAAAQKFRQLLLAQVPNTPLATLSLPAQQALINQFILAQKNIAEVMAGTLFLSDSDNKPANIGLLLQEFNVLVARLDLGCAFYQLPDFTASAKTLWQNALCTELLYSPNFRRALLKLANIDMTELGAIVEAATARFIHAWDGIKLSAATREKFANHLGVNPQLLDDFIDAAGIVRYQLGCTQRLSNIIIAALTARQGIFKQYADMLEPAPVIKAVQNSAHSMLATVHNWQLNGALISFASCASSNNAAAAIKLMRYRTIQLTKALQLIELKCRPRVKLLAEQSCLLNALIKCTYYTALKSLATALRFAPTQPKALKIYELLLYKLDNYPIAVAMHVRQILLETAMQGLFMGLINVARLKTPSKQGVLIAASNPFSLNAPLRPKLKASLQTLEHLTPAQAKPVALGEGVLALIQVGSLTQPIVLPGGSSLAPNNKAVLLTTITLSNNSLLGAEYSSFVKSFNAATNLTLTGKELLSPSSEPASMLLQLCLAVANSDANLTQALFSQLLHQLAITGISTAWQERFLLPLHVAIIKNAQAILVNLITALREYSINVNAAIGQSPGRFTLLERAMMVNNAAIVAFLVQDFLANNIPFKLIDVLELDKIKCDYCMGLNNPIGGNDEARSKLLTSLMPYARQLSTPDCGVLLRLAAARDNSEAMLQLIALQTNINAADPYGQTPLHLAVLNDSVNCVALLLKQGANTYIPDRLLRAPMSIIAGGFNRKQCIKILRQCDARYHKLPVLLNSTPSLQVAEKIGVAISQNQPTVIAELITTTFYEHPALLGLVVQRLKDSIKKLPLNAQANHSGKTILWYLARTAMFGYQEALNRIISQLEVADIIDLELNAAPTEGEEEGITVLWLLSYLLHRGWAWALNKILETLPRRVINNLNLNAAAQQGTYKGQSVLFLLITAATNERYTEILETVLKQMSEEKTRDLALNTPIESDNNRGITVLWQLALAAANGYPKPLLIILNKLSDAAMQKLDLNVKAEAGERQGITVLWLLAFAAAERHPEPLLRILDKLNDAAVQKLDLNAKAETGEDKGITVLWLLAFASEWCWYQYQEPLLRILDKLNDAAVQKLDLNAKAEAGAPQGVTVLWLLAFAAEWRPGLLLMILNKLSDAAVQKLDLNAKAEKGELQGETGLWQLVHAAANGHPEPLLMILNKLSDAAVQKLDLNAKAEKGELQDETGLWELLHTASGHPEPLLIINQLHASNAAIPASYLVAVTEKGVSQGKTVLWLLADTALRDKARVLELERIIIQLGVEGRKHLDLNAALESDKTDTVLLNLAFALAKGNTRILETILADYKEKISSLRLNDVLQGEERQGATGLWALAYAATNGYPLALETVLEALPDSAIQKLDLNAAATTPAAQNCQGKTVLWLLLEKKIANPHATELDKIIELLINNQAINAHNLNAIITIGGNKGKSLLWLLVDGAAKGYPATLEKIVSKLENKEVQMLKLNPDVPRKYMEILGKIKDAYSTNRIQYNDPSILFTFNEIMRDIYVRNLRSWQSTQQISNKVANNNGEKQSDNCSIC